VNVGYAPIAVAVNPVTNQIYVANNCGNDATYCSSLSTVTVIDGATNATKTINVGAYPYALAVDPARNVTYVSNYCGNDPTCYSPGTLTVIHGTSNATGTVTVGNFPFDVEVNSVTNEIWVVNNCGDDNNCGTYGSVTVVDGSSYATATVYVDYFPYYAAINPVTNQVYVVNNCGLDVNCSDSYSTVTHIDGNTFDAVDIDSGAFSYGLAINSVTNEIYVADSCGNDLSCSSAGTVTIIDGTNDSAGYIDTDVAPSYVAVDAARNQIYVPNECGQDLTCQSPGTVTNIDGYTFNTYFLDVGDGPYTLALNTVTANVYVPNVFDDTVSVIAGYNSPAALEFVPIAPCRVVDTRRSPNGTFNGPPIGGQTSRNFPIPQGACGIPSDAAAYSVNVTMVPIQGRPVGYLTIWPTGEDQPVVSTMNSLDGRIKANAAIVPAGYLGAVSVYASNVTNAVIDIDGYFNTPSNQTLQFYPLTPCRVFDTRNANGPLGGPQLTGGVPRAFPLLNSSCIPSDVNPLAYSMNFTVTPNGGQPMGYLTVWPTGGGRPTVSTLNNLTNTVVANAAIVPAGDGGAISAYADQNTNLVGDINGYFDLPDSGLELYTGVPCRVIDTRKGNGGFSGRLAPPVNVAGSPCNIPDAAEAYVFNATVVPFGALGYLTLWPHGDDQPGVSTLNAIDGYITTNMAVVPNNDGYTDAYAAGETQLILDISSYFAPSAPAKTSQVKRSPVRRPLARRSK
jgi:DNA-binding beta-propeller fold protein YncE